MKPFNKSVHAAILIVLLCNCSDDEVVEPEPQEILIAHYPLSNDGNDVTGKNGPMVLTNTPFEKGGIYCNGKYVYGDPDYCLAESPSIASFNTNSFSISMEFYVTEMIDQPVWVIGTSCRWLGFYLNPDGTLNLLYNNANHVNSTKRYVLNQWQKAEISYDGATVEMFLDDDLVTSLKFGSGFVPLETCGGTDNQITVTNYSNGQVFKGFVKNLEVYNLK